MRSKLEGHGKACNFLIFQKMQKNYDFSRIPGKTVIGITGPIAGGKSLVLSYFRKYGAETISADEVNREILSDPAVFGIISNRYSRRKTDGTEKFGKPELAEIIFNNPEEKKWLEDFLHPKIIERSFQIALNSKKTIIAVEMPLLFEAGLGNSFSLTLCIHVPEEILYDRASVRGWTREHFEKRCAGQFPQEKKCSMADVIIQNDGSAEKLEEKIRKFCSVMAERH